MNDVMKKRLVGAVVLVIIGVMVPLLLARCMHGGDGGDSDSMRVYEISPNGQTQPAGAQKQAKQAEPDAAPAQDEHEDIDGSSGVPRHEEEDDFQTPDLPEAVSPASESSASSSSSSRQESRGSASASSQTRQSQSSSAQASQQSSGGGSDSLERTGSMSGWVVQVASFGDEANARRLAEQLSGDYDAFYRAGDVNGKTYYRVRIGPFDSESAARDAAAKLQSQGRNTLVQRAD